MVQERGRKRGRRGRRGAAVRTPVEGDWLRLHRGTGLGYVIAEDGGRRRRVYLGPYYADQEPRTLCRETVERAARLIREGRVLGASTARVRTSNAAPALSLADLGAKFLRHARGYYGAASNEVEFYKLVLGQAEGLYGSLPASDFGPLALKAVRDRMAESGRWARDTLNAHVGRLVRVFKWASSNELVPESVWGALRTVDGLRRGRAHGLREPGKVLPVAPADVDAVLLHLSRQVRAMVDLQRLTGMRPGEVVILRASDVDRTGDVWVYRPSRHKSSHRGQERTVYLGPKAQAVLGPFLLRSADDFAFSPSEAEEERLHARQAARTTPDGYGNTRGTNRVQRPQVAPGDRYTVGTYRQAVERACAKSGVPKWSPNRLRHLAATEMRRRFGIEAARLMLGHSDANTTTIYAERDVEAARRVAVEVG